MKEVSSKLNEFGDLPEFGDWSEKEIMESIDCLLSKIKDINDTSIIKNIRHICLNNMNSHKVFFDLDTTVSCIVKLNSECISYVLTFLGFSGKKEYINVIQPFLDNDILKEDAEEALIELNYGISKNRY